MAAFLNSAFRIPNFEFPMPTLPISAVIATRDRPDKLLNLFASMRRQDVTPAEIVVVDASEDDATKALCEGSDAPTGTRWIRSQRPGAASQRNEGVASATQSFILFADDDMVLEDSCLRALWEAMQGDPGLGGVNAIITNQQYHPPGRISRAFYGWLNGEHLDSYAGRVIGPAVNFRAEDGPGLPQSVPVDWLDLGCTLYRQEALPRPPFDSFFKGYSYGEDLTLSLIVRRHFGLMCVRKARAFHDRINGAIKVGAFQFARMTLVNRHHIMARVLGRNRVSDYVRLVAFELFSLASTCRTPLGRRQILPALVGKLMALGQILCHARGQRPSGIDNHSTAPSANSTGPAEKRC